MRKAIHLLLSVLVAHSAFGQKTEHFIGLNSGFFSFQGPSATKYSSLNISSSGGYTNNPFGAKSGLSYGISYQIQHVSKSNFIAGVSIGYENLRSQTTINTVDVFTGTANEQRIVSGRSNLSNQFINGYPYLGYRFAIRQVAVDLTGGVDLGYLFSTNDIGRATDASGQKYQVSRERDNVKLDIRPRLQLSAYYARLGIYGGYAHGLVNYRSGWVGGTNQCNSELVRFGVLYKLKG
jgi:hypothetical protein